MYRQGGIVHTHVMAVESFSPYPDVLIVLGAAGVIVPLLMRLPLYVGLGLLVLGMLWSMVPTMRDAIRKRDPLPLVALLLVVGLIVLVMFRD